MDGWVAKALIFIFHLEMIQFIIRKNDVPFYADGEGEGMNENIFSFLKYVSIKVPKLLGTTALPRNHHCWK